MNTLKIQPLIISFAIHKIELEVELNNSVVIDSNNLMDVVADKPYYYCYYYTSIVADHWN